MKKLTLIALLISMMTISAQAQWFDFSENMNRAVVGFNTGLVGFRNVTSSTTLDPSTWDLADVGVGVSVAIAGVYAEFVYVNPDHRFDSHIVMGNWEDHSALTFNVGYQIPIYRDYVFITPMIGYCRATTGYTEGNNIGIDVESQSIYHKYTAVNKYHGFNYGAGLTVVPCKWFEINLNCSAHAATAGIAVNIMNYQN